MTLHKAGYGLLLKILAALIIINSLLFLLIENETINYSVLSASSIFYFFVLNFFRNPKREVIIDDNTILAPSDGKIVVIEETYEPEYLKENRIQVSIFMNVTNVHIQWYPINGIVKYIKYHSGRFMAAYLPKSSTENERTTLVFENKKGVSILMRQIAGALARRIVYYAKEGEEITQDQHEGFIKFGSRIDLYLPLNTKINVELDQKVVGSQTVIGTFE
jgi:phosphatidylserine decarboxylase